MRGPSKAGNTDLSPARAMLDPMPAETAAPPQLVLVVGAEELLVDRAVARVVAAKRAADPETETRDLTPGNFTPGTFAELVSPSLFGESRVVVVRSAQDLAADDAATLIAALDNLA